MSGKHLPRGGHGGSGQVAGDGGKAIGGDGGRGGDAGYGNGGDGGGASLHGTGVSIGGDGGDAGRIGRPALGARSTCERPDVRSGPFGPILLLSAVDAYGILVPGRGGDGGIAFIEHNGREYCLNVLLRLLEIWHPKMIDVVDGFGASSPQEWWDRAIRSFPFVCERAMEHMRTCEDIQGEENIYPPSPYD